MKTAKTFIALILCIPFFSTAHAKDIEYDIAIIGGGVSGNYIAYQLLKHSPDGGTKPKIAIFESTDRIGGRLWTIKSALAPHVPIELGGMRFEAQHQHVRQLVKELKLATTSFAPRESDNLINVRGKIFRQSDVTSTSVLPYDLLPQEKNITPSTLILNALKKISAKFGQLSKSEWLETRDKLTWKGQPLHMISFQAFMQENISPEAFHMLVDLGYIQMTANISLYNAIGSFVIANNESAQAERIINGYQLLPETLATLAQKNGATIQLNRHLTNIQKIENGYRLEFIDDNGNKHYAISHKIILTMTPAALVKLCSSAEFLKKNVNAEELQVHSANPLTKLFFIYSHPWWHKLGLYSGSSTTDAPNRYVFYFNAEKDAPNGDITNDNAVILASYQGSYTPFWQSIAQHPNAKHYPGKRLIDLAHEYLQKMHHVNHLEKPIAAFFMDWTVAPSYGAYFFWHVGIKPKEWYLKHMELIADSGIYIAGSEYSENNGWVEGALESSDMLLKSISAPTHRSQSIHIPDHYA